MKLYILKSSTKKICKLGISNNPEFRLKTIQNYCRDAQLVSTHWMPFPKMAERRLHNRLWKHKYKGFRYHFSGSTEWYSIKPYQLQLQVVAEMWRQIIIIGFVCISLALIIHYGFNI